MFHKSKLGEHGHKFPHDLDGHVPHEGDDWRAMNFDHGAMDPDEDGISEEEKAKRIKYLDKEWWPKVIGWVNDQQAHLGRVHGKSFIQHWERVVNQPPPEQHGFEVEKID